MRGGGARVWLSGVMANSYLPWGVDEPFLLPPDVREWLPGDHLAWFLRAVVAEIDTSALHAARPLGGAGRRAFDPDMLLGVLLYAYCIGIRSSREIERRCYVDVAFRVLTGNQHPDHTTIARFRQRHQAVAAELFVQVLALCQAAGIARVGVVAVDGTKMGAPASLAANRDEASLRAEVDVMLHDADRVDAAENDRFGDARGDELPDELVDPSLRARAIRRALAELEQRQAERDAEDTARREARAERERQAAAQGRRATGRPLADADLVAAAEAALAERIAKAAARRAQIEARAKAAGRTLPPTRGEPREVKRARQRLERERARAAADTPSPTLKRRTKPLRVNTTDPDSRAMSVRGGWVQGYNAQAAVNDCGVVVAAAVTQQANDFHQVAPMITALTGNLAAIDAPEPVGTLLFDAGYYTEANLKAPGPDRLIALRNRHRDDAAALAKSSTHKKAMAARLDSPDGQALYRRRAPMIEPLFGNLKHNRGWDRFIRRGLDAVTAEWHLIHTAGNLLKLHAAS